MKSPMAKDQSSRRVHQNRLILTLAISLLFCYVLFFTEPRSSPGTRALSDDASTHKLELVEKRHTVIMNVTHQEEERPKVPPHQELLPEQSKPDYNIWVRYVANASVYLEWGSGGSTYQAVKLGVPFIFAIENVVEWRQRVEERIAMIKKPNQEVTIYSPPFPEVNARGYPVSSKDKESWINYPNGLKACPKKPDLVFVDGRFRVACALTALLNLSDKTIIIIHDFWTRPTYHEILPFVKILERSSDSTIVFQRAESFDTAAAEQLLEKYRYEGE